MKGGVVVVKINKGVIDDQTRMRDGFIITKANDQAVTSLEELNSVISKGQKRILLEGFYPGYEGAYQYPIELE